MEFIDGNKCLIFVIEGIEVACCEVRSGKRQIE